MAMVIITQKSGEKTALPNPCEYSTTQTDIDSTGERAGGYLKRNRIRSWVWRIDIGWQLLTPAQVQEIMTAIAAAEFDVCFIAPTPTFEAAATMYAGPVAMELKILEDDGKPDEARYDLTFALVEY